MASVITPYAILSFPTLFSPKPRSEGAEAVYSASLLFGEDEQKSPEFKKLQEAVRSCAIEKWGDKVSMASLMSPFRDAGEKADKYQGYSQGTVYINPWTKQKPGVVNARLQDVLDPDEVYAGQIVRAAVTPFAWAASGRKGVSFGLNHIQIIKADAPRIDGRAPANKVFGAVEEMEDAPF